MLTSKLKICAWLALTCLPAGGVFQFALAEELAGDMGLEYRYHPYHSVSEHDHNSNLSLFLEPAFSKQFDRENSAQFVPFFRLDQHDSKRTHFDIRELHWETKPEPFRAVVGIDRVDWGVTSSYHVIQIVNQIDLIEHPVYQRKLGQPMAMLAYEHDAHHLEAFVLPGFRERPFSGRKGRIRFTPRVDTSQAQYESDAEEKHVDGLLRYSLHTEPVNFGIYQFWGTSRDPSPLLGTTADGETVIVPYYPIISQTGVSGTVDIDDLEFRLEWVSRENQGPHFQALIGGFQYTLADFLETGTDLYLIAEYHYGETGSGVLTPFNNDWFAGFILNLKDKLNTSILIGDVVDNQSDSHTPLAAVYFALTEKLNLEIEYRGLVAVPPGHALGSLRNEDFLQVLLRYRF